jgi:hypothetical protein
MSKTKRLKKHNRVKSAQKSHELYRERFWLAGAGCLTRPVMGGLLPGAAGTSQIADTYRLKHTWRGFSLVFQTDGKKYWVDSLECVSPHALNASEFKELLDKAQDKLFNDTNPKYVTCAAYFCTISQTVDLDAMVDECIDWLQSHGAFNGEWCNYCRILRPD